MSTRRERSQLRVVMGRCARLPWRRAIRTAFRTRRRDGFLLLPERLEGAIYGHLVGDALGVPYESLPADQIDLVEWRGQGAHGQPAGTWSDDGALMLALLDSLLSEGFDPDDQGRRASAWRDQGRYAPGGQVFDIGSATAAAMARIAAGTPAGLAGAADARGNGSLMRILPLALVMRDSTDEELIRMTAQASRVTHASAEAQVACALYSLVVRRLLGGERDRADVLAGARHDIRASYAADGIPGSPEASEPRHAVAALELFEAWPGRSGHGRVVDSFWSAWDAFARADDYRETVVRAVRYGNDTDTTAAVAGGLAGVYWGVAGIPAGWRRSLRDGHIARALVDRLIETERSEWDGQPWRTSTTNPLRVDALDLSGLEIGRDGGSVGITFLPGKRYIGYHSGAHWRDVDADAAVLRDLGLDVLLLLVEDRELERCRVTDIESVIPAHGLDLVRFPIRDPLTPDDGPAFRGVIVGLLDQVRSGRSLAIACRGGLDRSGMAAACLLREAGLAADDAIDRVQRARRHALTLPDQQAFVRSWPPA